MSAENNQGRYVAPEPNAMYTLGHEKWKRAGPTPLSSTAGAIEIKDSKGRVVGMEKVTDNNIIYILNTILKGESDQIYAWEEARLGARRI